MMTTVGTMIREVMAVTRAFGTMMTTRTIRTDQIKTTNPVLTSRLDPVMEGHRE